MEDDIKPKVGSFFLIIGVSLIIFFVMTDLGKEINYNYLFFGLGAIGLGFFMRRGAEPPPPSGRFSWIKKIREKEKDKK